MSWVVRIRPKAEGDLLDAYLWYEKARPGLGNDFKSEVRLAVQLLEQNPERTGIYYHDFRRLLLRRFPYKIFYRIEGDVVIIFRVIHIKRDHTQIL